ncbi:MAG: segregation/condensation protein A [Candidatus Vogelbacteria bacterium]|nr:segregation/condensation protein A [Candidatus Vogelbacteria bacterium]
MPQDQFKVNVGNSNGPLVLILELVQQRKMSVSDVSLAEITDSFIAHLETLRAVPLDEVAQFLVVAATLMLIKSRSLLPNLPISNEEEINIKDLEARLNIYKQMKDKALIIHNQFDYNRVLFANPIKRKISFRIPKNREDGTNEVSWGGIVAAMRDLLLNVPRLDKIPSKAIEKVVSVEQMMASIVDRLERAVSTTFSKMHGKKGTAEKSEKVHVIVSFLALLELAKRGTVALKQSSHFEEIEIESQKFNVPRYA